MNSINKNNLVLIGENKENKGEESKVHSFMSDPFLKSLSAEELEEYWDFIADAEDIYFKVKEND